MCFLVSFLNSLVYEFFARGCFAYAVEGETEADAVVEKLLTSLLFTYLLHGAESPEKLTGFQLVKKFPAFYGTRRFITAFKSARHLSLS